MAEKIIIPGVGDVIADKYLIKTELGRGAYGVVFGCDQVDVGRYVAVKTLLPQAFLKGEIVQRFHREAQLISRLDHPNVIRLFDYGVHDDLLYMAVEFVSGETLAKLIERSAPMAPETVIEISLQILAGLDHAHQEGIVHRDLKPENVIVIEKESGFEAKILDFGISKLTRGDETEKGAMNTLTQDGAVLGTPHYMSPENIVGDPCDHRADIYALGVMMYEMVAAEHPFDAVSPSAVFIKHLTAEAALLDPEIQNSALGATIFHALEKQPEDRIQTAIQMQEMLRADTFVPRESAEETESKRKKVLWFGLFFGGLVAILTLLAVYFLRPPAVETKIEPTIVEKKVDDGEEDTETLVFDEPDYELASPELREALVVAKTLRNQAALRSVSAQEIAALKVSKDERKKNDKIKKTKQQDVKKTPVATKLPKEKKTKLIKVKFSSVPSNAVVKVNNVRIGKTPISKYYSDPHVSRTVTFSHIGYQQSRIKFSPGRHGSLHVKLKPTQLKIQD